MNLSELIKRLEWWKENFGGDIEVTLSIVTNGPTISRGDIIDIICGAEPKKGVTNVTLFGGKKK